MREISRVKFHFSVAHVRTLARIYTSWYYAKLCDRLQNESCFLQQPPPALLRKLFPLAFRLRRFQWENSPTRGPAREAREAREARGRLEYMWNRTRFRSLSFRKRHVKRPTGIRYLSDAEPRRTRKDKSSSAMRN